MGPIQIFLLGFADFAATGSIVDELGKLSDAGTIRVIDARLIYKESADELVLARLSDLDDAEREELRAAAGALIGLGAGLVLAENEDEAAAGMLLGAAAAMDIGEIGLSDAEIDAIGDDLAVGDAMLLLVIENVWATGLRDAIREAGAVFVRQEYLRPEGLVALGSLLGIEVAIDTAEG